MVLAMADLGWLRPKRDRKALKRGVANVEAALKARLRERIRRIAA